MLRVGLGLVFLWFGALKFFPGLSPAQSLAARTIEVLSLSLLTPAVSIPLLAAWECLIGIGLISGRWTRTTLLLLALQMAGTVTPLFLFPSEAFTLTPFAPTLEGQYIIKNIVLVCAALVIGATVRGGYLRRRLTLVAYHDSGGVLGALARRALAPKRLRAELDALRGPLQRDAQ